MRARRHALVRLAAIACIWILPGRAGAVDPARAKFGEAVVQYGVGHFEACAKLLDEAQSTSKDPLLLAKIHRQRGLVLEVTHHPGASVASFVSALSLDPKIDLNRTEHRPDVLMLFDCAKQLRSKGMDAGTVQAKHGAAIDAAPRVCPGDAVANPRSEVSLPPLPPVPPKLAAPQVVASVEGAPSVSERRLPWTFWATAGLSVVGAGVGAGLGATALSNARSQRDGTSDASPSGPALGANVSFGIAIASGATALVILLLSRD